MHITYPLKRNIFTGLWHRTLPTLHCSVHQPKLNSPPSSFQPPPNQHTLWVLGFYNSAMIQDPSHEHRPRVSPDTEVENKE